MIQIVLSWEKKNCGVLFLLSENKTEESWYTNCYCLIQNSNSSSSSNSILMSFHPHRFTSGHRQISKLFSHTHTHTHTHIYIYIDIDIDIYQPPVKSIHKTNHFTNIKIQTQIFKELVPSVLPLLKECTRHMLVLSILPPNLSIPG